MTLIIKLPTAFTDTTIPKLSKDSVISSAGARLLVDMKSVGTWPSQATSISASDQIFSLVDNSFPTLSTAGTHVYSPTRGALLGNQSLNAVSGLWLSNASTNIFNDATHSWAFTFWFFRGAATTGTFILLQDQAVDFSSNGTAGPATLNVYGASGANNLNYLLGANYSILRRVGFTVYQDSSYTWKLRTVTDNTVSSESNLNGATNTLGGAGIRASASSTLRPRVFPVPSGYGGTPTDYAFYRVYVEDLTLSGRTYQQVFDADWARGNGRYS